VWSKSLHRLASLRGGSERETTQSHNKQHQKSIRSSSMSKKEDDEKKSTTTILQSAPPPWHAVASWVLICSISIACLPSSELLDQVATPETFTNRVYPDYVSIETLVYTRLAIVIMMIAVTLYSIFFRSGYVHTYT